MDKFINMFHVRHAQIAMIVSAAVYFWLGLFMILVPVLIAFVVFVGGATNNSIGLPEIVIMLFFGLFCLVLAALVLVVTYFLERRAQWAWYVAVVIAVIYISSAYMFFSLIMLPGLINDRKQFGF